MNMEKPGELRGQKYRYYYENGAQIESFAQIAEELKNSSSLDEVRESIIGLAAGYNIKDGNGKITKAEIVQLYHELNELTPSEENDSKKQNYTVSPQSILNALRDEFPFLAKEN